MIKEQLIIQDNNPIAVILAYQEYQRLKKIADDYEDYIEAAEIKKTNKEWVDHNVLKKEIELS